MKEKAQINTKRQWIHNTVKVSHDTGHYSPNNVFVSLGIYKDSSGDDGEGGGILTSGNTITVEESRAADVYYIGIRRDKKSGINNSVFDFLE